MSSVCAVPVRSALVLGQVVPLDWSRQDQPQIGISLHCSCFWNVQLLVMNTFQSRQQLKAQQPTEGKTYFALSVTIDILLIDRHLGAVPEHALDHGGDLGGRAGLQL
jgi:hypothetical protein